MKHFFIVCDIELRFPNAFGAFHFEGIHQGTNFINILQAAFHTKVFYEDFMSLQFGFVIFWQNEFNKEAACKMLVKLTKGKPYYTNPSLRTGSFDQIRSDQRIKRSVEKISCSDSNSDQDQQTDRSKLPKDLQQQLSDEIKQVLMARSSLIVVIVT